ncbi:MAG: hypothetical protein ACJ74H_11910 [Thermoanaerobaculia bacterium]
MLIPDVAEHIRAIFLHREPYVTKKEAAALLGWSFGQLKLAITEGDIETYETCAGVRIPLAEVAAIARQRWQPAMIEEALGADAAAILPAPLWTRTITVRLPRYEVAVLDYFARKEGVTVDAILARRLDGLMSEHSEELAGVIEDFSVALNWPEPHDAKARA